MAAAEPPALTRSLRRAAVALVLATSAMAAAPPPNPPAPPQALPTSAPLVTPAATVPLPPPGPLPRKIAAADFARPAALSGIKLSPDGQSIAARMQQEGKEVLGVFTLASGKTAILQLPAKTDLRWFRWAGNGRILISLGSTATIRDFDFYATRLMVHDLATGGTHQVGNVRGDLEGDNILFVDPDGRFVLQQYHVAFWDDPDVFRVNLDTNEVQKVQPNRGAVREWFADDAGVVRVGLGTLNGRWFMVYRRSADAGFETVARGKPGDQAAVLQALRFTSGSDQGYVLSNEDNGRYALYNFDYAKQERGALVFESPTNDIADFELNRAGTGLASISWTDDRERVLWLDPALRARQREIDATLPRQQNWIVSRSRDDKRLLFWTGSASDPGAYYIYAPAEKAMQQLARVNDALQPADLAPVSYVQYKARDGLMIPAYVTMPVGRSPQKLPLIIMPHGGPYQVRDRLSFDPFAQLLANRGYVVLQPNFRGSDGYGKDFYAKGEGQWGRQMQDDLDDGMDWLVAQGLVDPKRVCIVGASYGGYAALWGATRNPERYRCAASFAGVSDVKRQLAYQSDALISRRYRQDWRKTVKGDAKFDLADISPLNHVDKLQVPVLLGHGQDDQRVPFLQSKLYADALGKLGKPHEMHSYPGLGHDFDQPAAFQDWLERLDSFQAKHNPAQ